MTTPSAESAQVLRAAKVIADHAWTYPDTFCECLAYVNYATYATHVAAALSAQGLLARHGTPPEKGGVS